MKKFDYPLLVSILKQINKKDLTSMEHEAIEQIMDDYSARIREIEEIRKNFREYDKGNSV